jgi:hypothetical protein
MPRVLKKSSLSESGLKPEPNGKQSGGSGLPGCKRLLMEGGREFFALELKG